MKLSSASARSSRSNVLPRIARAVALVALAASSFGVAAAAPQDAPFLATLRHRSLVASTVTPNGDQNPYAVVVAPASAGTIKKGDVLMTNFNDQSNLQGTGTTIVDYDPVAKKTSVFARLPREIANCPGGVGLSTAMTMLTSGWVIVGSTNSTDGTTKTKGAGCLIVLDATGKLVTTWTGPNIDDPWGNMATLDKGSTATLFVSMAGFDVPGPGVLGEGGYPVTVRKATVLRLDLTIPQGGPPAIASQTVVANGFGQRADKDAFLVGPTGLALAPDGTLYASDALGNAIVKIPDALTRTTSAGTGEVVTKDGLLRRPLALIMAPNGNLITCNALNGQLVEIDPATGKQLVAQWVDVDQAQSPPGNGDLFGLAIAPDGKSIYYVEDDVNALYVDAP